MKICQEIPNLAKIRQTYRTLYMRTSIRFTVADDIKSEENVSGYLDRPVFVLFVCKRVLY